MKKEEYLKTVTDQIRCEKARCKITKEMESHIEEQKAEYMSEGMEAEEAEAEAVRDMGDPVEAGAALDMIHRPRMAWGWIGLIAILYVVGFAIQILMQRDVTPYLENRTLQYAIRLAGGFGVMVGICYVDYSRIGLWAREITLILFGILYIGMALCGTHVNGMIGWIYGIPVNIRMLGFLFVPLYGAVLFHYRGQGYQGVVKSILWMIPALLTEFKASSTSTTLILFLTFVLVLSFAIYKKWFLISRGKGLVALWSGVILLFALGGLMILRSGVSYRSARIQAILHPGSAESAYPAQVVRQLLKGSQFVGTGEDVRQIIQTLPDGVSYGLAYVISCYGILAAVLLIVAIVVLFLKFLGKSLRQKNQMGMTMGIGCSVVLLMQLLFYVLGNIGYTPMGLMYCPFITYGGTGMLITNILLGLLLGIYRYQDIPLETEVRKYHISISVKKSG